MNPLRVAPVCVDLALASGVLGGRVARVWGPRRRGAKAFGLFALMTLLGVASLAVQPPPPQLPSNRGTVVFYPRDHFHGSDLLAITRRGDGTLDVSFDPAHLYQDATTTAVTRSGRSIETRYLEVIEELGRALPSDGRGFRDPYRVRACCPVLEYDTRSAGETAEVWSNGNGDWLVVLTKFGRA